MRLDVEFRRLRAVMAFAALLICVRAMALPGVDPGIEDLKKRVAAASAGERPRLCVQIAQRQLAELSRLYAASEDEQAQPALADVVAFSELARDYSIQARKQQKQTEIAVREMTRKLTELMHTLGHDEQPPVKDAITRLQRVRDDLLASMFSKGVK